MDNSDSSPERALDCTGSPSIGSVVKEAIIVLPITTPTNGLAFIGVFTITMFLT